MLDFISQELREVGQQMVENGITLNEARDALKAVNLLRKNGIPQEHWRMLVETSEKLSELDFREAALKLLKLEKDTSKDYRSAVSHFEQLATEIDLREKKKQKIDQEITSANAIINKLNRQTTELNKKAEQEKTKTSEVLAKEGLIRSEVEAFRNARVELESKGLDIATFISIAREFSGSKELTLEVRKRLKEIKSLTEAQMKINNENNDLQVRRNSLQLEVNGLSAKKEVLKTDNADLEGRITRESEQLKALKEQREIKKRQYDLFEALLAMFSGGSPYQDATPEKLASAVQQLAEGWYAGYPVGALRGVFVISVCGGFLHSLHCTRCGARFIVDRAHNSYIKQKTYYDCPVCGSFATTKPNDDFLKAMSSEEEFNRSKALQQKLESLKPLEVFLDIPCCVCHKPMSNIWTREQVLKAFRGWGHEPCLR